MTLPAVVETARERLVAAGAGEIEVGLVLGSGLSYLAERLEGAVSVPYEDLPGFPTSTVPGHAGNLVTGALEGVRVGMAQGRFHLYEGYDPSVVTLPVRLLHALGARWLLITNAAGSLDRRRGPGTLMAIRDHLDLQFASPLRGRDPAAIEDPFPDLSNVWDTRLRERLHAVALAEGIRLEEGIYVGVLGPSYETRAEIRFLRRIGADAVGMSTVAEAIAAAEIGLPVVGLSLLTNYAAGIGDERLSHDHVTEVAEASRDTLERLLRSFLRVEWNGTRDR